MAFVTGGDKVLLYYRRIGTICLLNIMDAVTIGANCFINPYFSCLLLDKGYGAPVKIVEICFYHIGGNAVLLHKLGITVAFAAKMDRLDTERCRSGVFDSVGQVTVRAYGNIVVILLYQRSPVNATYILFIDVAVTFRACLRYFCPRL